MIPPNLIQPYVENAIIHGMRSKPSDGIVKVEFKRIDNFIYCYVTDNGIGVLKSQELYKNMKKHKSHGLNIVKESINEINTITENFGQEIMTQNAFEDPDFPGTKVEIKLPILN